VQQYADLHVVPHVDDIRSCQKVAKTLSLAGYSVTGLTLPTGLFRERAAELRKVFSDNDVETVLRVDLASKSREELLRSLRRFRNTCDIVAVKCLSTRVAHVACRDRRVDVVFFDLENASVGFSHALANLLRGAIEMNLVSAMFGDVKTGVYETITKALSIAGEHKVKVVLSSGADRPEMIRSPSQVVALASTLGLPQRAAYDAVSSTPISIVAENAKRRSAAYIEEGVRVVSSTVR
jgi:RNase P/RNase MRP subunit p30